MIATRDKSSRHPSKKGLIMADYFSHYPLAVTHIAHILKGRPVYLPYTLMSEADTEDTVGCSEGAHYRWHDSRLGRNTGPRREKDTIKGGDLIDGYFIIPDHHGFTTIDVAD
jgi:hypothetical protein